MERKNMASPEQQMCRFPHFQVLFHLNKKLIVFSLCVPQMTGGTARLNEHRLRFRWKELSLET